MWRCRGLFLGLLMHAFVPSAHCSSGSGWSAGTDVWTSAAGSADGSTENDYYHASSGSGSGDLGTL